MALYGICVAVAASLALAVAAELVSWWWVYRKAEYQQLVKDITRKKKQMEEGSRVAERSTKKRATQQLKTVQEQYRSLVQQGSWQTMKAQLAPSLLVLVCLPFLLPRLKGLVIAQLPFEPFWLFKSITQQGLEDAGPTDCSASCIFFLAVAASRSIVRKLIPIPELPSMFETVTSE